MKGTSITVTRRHDLSRRLAGVAHFPLRNFSAGGIVAAEKRAVIKPVAPAAPEYPTPISDYQVTKKVSRPWDNGVICDHDDSQGTFLVWATGIAITIVFLFVSCAGYGIWNSL